jgi:L-asparaginase
LTVDQATPSLPTLLLLATGGTIAGRGATSTSLNAYTAGALAGSELLQALPQLQGLAHIQVEQLANVDSADLQFQHWIQLVTRIREAFAASPELAGVVITHGTNTLEETAWLLELLIDDPRPVVLVGAMRPATALSADGPLNLFQAVQVALSARARGHGVLVVMDGQNGGVVKRWLPIWMGVSAATDHTSERKAATAAERHGSPLGKTKQDGAFKGDTVA